MATQRTFLTAEWRNLLMLNYAVDPELLRTYVPSGTELDQFEGKTYVSLIGFEFNETRVLGWTIPFHQSFEEVNLRFYVRRSERRGVVFVGELVPRFAVAMIANSFYGERYARVPMTHRIANGNDGSTVEFSWGSGADACSIWAETSGQSYLPQNRSLPQFITEHYWGYAAQRTGGTREYQVEHPKWTVRETKHARLSGNAGKYYGAEFAGVLEKPPDSAFLADGSEVIVFRGMAIR